MIQADPLADGVVELDRVDAEMGAGQCQAVASDLGPKDQQGPGHPLVGGETKGPVQQLDDLLAVREPPAARDHLARDPGQVLRTDAAGAGRPVERRELVAGGADGEGQARLEKLEDRAQLALGDGAPAQVQDTRPVALELGQLDAQPLGEDGRPGDVGAAVRVVAHPARDGEKPGRQRAPVLGVELGRHLEHDVVDAGHRRLEVPQRVQRLAMLQGQVDRRVGHMGRRLEAGQQLGPAAAPVVLWDLDQGHQVLTQRLRDREGRMGRDDEAVIGALDALAEGAEGQEAALSIGGLGPDERPDPRHVGGRVQLAQIAAQMAGAAGRGIDRQPLDQPPQRLLVEGAGELPAEIEGQEPDRVGEGVLRGPLAKIAELADEIGLGLRDRVGPLRDRERPAILRMLPDRAGACAHLGVSSGSTGRSRHHPMLQRNTEQHRRRRSTRSPLRA